jgi:hypothetical protein
VRPPDPRQSDLFGNDEARQRLALELKASKREAPAYKAGRTQRGQPKRKRGLIQQTSRDAHEAIKPKASAIRSRILAELQLRGSTGATCDELEQALGLSHQTASARLREMAKAETIYDSGHRRETRTGRTAIIWRAAEGER